MSWRYVSQLMKLPYHKIMAVKKRYLETAKPSKSVKKKKKRKTVETISPLKATRVTSGNVT